MSAKEGLPHWTLNNTRAAALVIGCGLIGVVAYVLQEDRQVQKRKKARTGEKQALELLHQLKRETGQIEHQMERDVDPSKREYNRAHCNEMFLRLLERLDTIQPRDAVLQHQDRDPSPPFAIQSDDVDDKSHAWKVVGSFPRRLSLPVSQRMNSTGKAFVSIPASVSPESRSPPTKPNDRRRSVPSDHTSAWGSFDGLQWNGHPIFDAPESIATTTPTRVNTATILAATSSPFAETSLNSSDPFPHSRIQQSEPYHPSWDNGGSDRSPLTEMVPDDISSVPMLPGAQRKSIHRQQRSSSFSIGQDVSIFGYGETDYPIEHYQHQLPLSLVCMSAVMNDELQERDMYFEEHQRRVRSQSYDPVFWLRASRPPDSSGSPHGRVLDGRSSVQNDSRHPNIWSHGPLTRQQQQKRLSMFDMEKKGLISSPLKSGYSLQPLTDHLGKLRFSSSTSYGQTSLPSPDASLGTLCESSVSAASMHLEQVPEEKMSTSSDAKKQQHISSSEVQLKSNTSNSLNRVLYMVEFKAARSEFFYAPKPMQLHLDDLVIVEADRGKDLGKIVITDVTPEQVILLQQEQQQEQQQGHQRRTKRQLNKAASNTNDPPHSAAPPASSTSVIAAGVAANKASPPLLPPSLPPLSPPASPTAGERQQQLKRIIRLAAPEEIDEICAKSQEERKALQVCQQKIKQRKLRMDVVDAEYQWDRRKLTFYFTAERRIDFRELVRELFKIYKTRIWMCAVTPPTNITSSKRDQQS
ncbi:PSP1 C-terminal conserved region-domain-containing protein [Syncephalastrum racemosum]|uniref:PSP1 C-terminal conserved region-domain-containing protein n=1 Tax=Syncephalastrum racemosum TaxID=13706 RepID=A0A1X2HPH1_SYNRA|nr:PSP1 C-terminal conserved region-domain-containing protein [Syncephalastrum racemosum]